MAATETQGRARSAVTRSWKAAELCNKAGSAASGWKTGGRGLTGPVAAGAPSSPEEIEMPSESEEAGLAAPEDFERLGAELEAAAAPPASAAAGAGAPGLTIC